MRKRKINGEFAPLPEKLPTVNEILMRLLGIADVFHQFHWTSSKNLAVHEELQKLYECIRDNADKIAELAVVSKTIDFAYTYQSEGSFYNGGGIVDRIMEVKEYIKGLRETLREPKYLNVLDDFEVEISSCQYKLEMELVPNPIAVTAKKQTRSNGMIYAGLKSANKDIKSVLGEIKRIKNSTLSMSDSDLYVLTIEEMLGDKEIEEKLNFVKSKIAGTGWEAYVEEESPFLVIYIERTI